MTKVVRFLMVDDDQDRLAIVMHYLRLVFAADGVQTEIIGVLDGETGLNTLLDDGPFDLLLSDVSLPKMNGIEMLRVARNREVSTPAIFLSGHDSTDVREKAFEAGADDYFSSPCDLRQLEIRIKELLLRRSTDVQPVSGPERIEVGDLIIDKTRQEVSRAGKRVALTPIEFYLLELLASEPGRAWPKSVLRKRIQSTSYEGHQREFGQHLKGLRKKLETDPKNPRYVLTVHGGGFKFNDAL